MNRKSAIAAAVYYILYSILYAGWLSHRSEVPDALGYSKAYLVFLAIAALPYFIPPLLARLGRRFGGDTVAFSLFVFVVLLAGAYVVGATWYYHTREHLFDPFVQVPPAPIDTDAGKAKNQVRILCLGGSTTECGDLPPDERYPAVLERMLRRQFPRSDIRVFNAGRSWYTTEHSLINWVTYYSDWKPDVVVVMHGINDLYRSFSPPAFAVGPYNDRWSHFYGPVIDAAKPRTFETYLSQFFQALEDSWFSRLRFTEADYPLEQYLSIMPFEVYLEKLVRYCRADGATVILVTEPSLYKEKPSPEERRVLFFSRYFCASRKGRLGLEFPTAASLAVAMESFNGVTRGVAREERVPLADTAPKVPKSLEYFIDDVHYTAAGAELVAQSVAEEVARILQK